MSEQTNVVPEWRTLLRDFASEDCHRISHRVWKQFRPRDHAGIVLYYWPQQDIYVAYFDDAEIAWSEADDEKPMFHSNIRSLGPSRTLIHGTHINAWLSHFMEIILPVTVSPAEVLEDEDE